MVVVTGAKRQLLRALSSTITDHRRPMSEESRESAMVELRTQEMKLRKNMDANAQLHRERECVDKRIVEKRARELPHGIYNKEVVDRDRYQHHRRRLRRGQPIREYSLSPIRYQCTLDTQIPDP
jgi:hypothetical protein